jgi:hypothetical protein
MVAEVTDMMKVVEMHAEAEAQMYTRVQEVSSSAGGGVVLAAKLHLWHGSQRCLTVVAATVGVCMCVDCKSAGY